MQAVQGWLFAETARLNGVGTGNGTNTTVTTTSNPVAAFWDMDMSSARHRLNPARLKDQMFAYTVTNQAMDTLTEVGLPFVLRFAQHLRERYFSPRSSYSRWGSVKGSSTRTSSRTSTLSHTHTKTRIGAGTNTSEPSMRKKRVVFEDEQEKGGVAERMFLDRVREEAALAGYELFHDYSEMVTQFGYVVLWSAIWPLAGGGCLSVLLTSLFPILPFFYLLSFLCPEFSILMSRLMVPNLIATTQRWRC
jgi:anoctamin-10